MNRLPKVHSLGLSVLCLFLWGCGKKGETLAEGLTEDLQSRLVALSIQQIETVDNFTPENFEALQRKHFETMTEEMRGMSLGHLPNRVKEIASLQMSQTVRLDEASVEVKWSQLAPERVSASVSLVGDRSYKTVSSAKEVKTQYRLPWILTLENGAIVFRHQGIRISSL